MTKKITMQSILKELAGFPPVYSLSVTARFRDAHDSDSAFDVCLVEDFVIASSHHRLSLEALESRLKLMSRQEFKELLLQLGAIAVAHTRSNWLLKKPVFDLVEVRS